MPTGAMRRRLPRRCRRAAILPPTRRPLPPSPHARGRRTGRRAGSAQETPPTCRIRGRHSRRGRTKIECILPCQSLFQLTIGVLAIVALLRRPARSIPVSPKAFRRPQLARIERLVKQIVTGAFRVGPADSRTAIQNGANSRTRCPVGGRCPPDVAWTPPPPHAAQRQRCAASRR